MKLKPDFKLRLKGVDNLILILVGFLIVVAVVVASILVANSAVSPFDQLTSTSIIDNILGVFHIGGSPA